MAATDESSNPRVAPLIASYILFHLTLSLLIKLENFENIQFAPSIQFSCRVRCHFPVSRRSLFKPDCTSWLMATLVNSICLYCR